MSLLQPVRLSFIGTAAVADPCTAPVAGYATGAKVAGPVTYIVDGDGLCVSVGPSQSQWVEIRLANFHAPELSEPGGKVAQAELDRLTFGQQVVCTVGGDRGKATSYDRVLARCTVDGRDVGDLLRAAGIQEGGNGRR